MESAVVWCEHNFISVIVWSVLVVPSPVGVEGSVPVSPSWVVIVSVVVIIRMSSSVISWLLPLYFLSLDGPNSLAYPKFVNGFSPVNFLID